MVTDEGIATVREAIGPHGPYLDPRREWKAPSTDDPAMRRARHDLHVNAWGLAFQARIGEAVRRIRGPRNSYVAPPTRSVGGERRAIGPDELRLPGGRTPHGFLRTDRGRQRIAVEEFAAIEPDLTIELRLREAEQAGACSDMRFQRFHPRYALRWSTTAQCVRAIRGNGRSSPSQRRRS